MIQINDNDSPIIVAQKIIHGIKAVPVTPARAIGEILTTGKAPKVGHEIKVDMFTDEEIREIAEYLLTYWKYHGEDEANE